MQTVLTQLLFALLVAVAAAHHPAAPADAHRFQALDANMPPHFAPLEAPGAAAEGQHALAPQFLPLEATGAAGQTPPQFDALEAAPGKAAEVQDGKGKNFQALQWPWFGGGWGYRRFRYWGPWGGYGGYPGFYGAWRGPWGVNPYWY